MSEDKVLAARNAAGGKFKEGYNCAEAIFLSFNELLDLHMDDDLVRITSGLGGGFGHAGCACGALTGSVLVLGALKGRNSTDIKERDVIYTLAEKYHDLFEERFGSTCCRALNPHPYDSQEHLKTCLKITGNTGKLLMQYITDEELV